MLSVEQAQAQVLAAAPDWQDNEEVPLATAGGRILARALLAGIDVPGEANSQMDGYALRASDLAAGHALPLAGRTAAGAPPAALPPGACWRVFTGAPVPAGCDSVVPQELARPDGQGRVAFSGTVRPGQWIRPAGSDLARGSEILPPGTALRAQHLAIAAAVGVGSLAVRRAPRVALLATGDELVEPGDALRPGGMYNSNRFQLAELLRVIGCRVLDLGQVPDRADAVEQALAGAAAQSELVLSSGGVSVGEEDHVRAAVERLGRIDMWRVAMKPGKPLAHGSIAGTPFFGVPGNPVSCLVSYLLFVRPFILRALGARQVLPQALRLPAAFTRSGDPERREFLRVRLDAQGGLELHPQQGPSQLGALVASDGLAEVPAGVQVAPGAMLVYHSLAALSGPP